MLGLTFTSEFQARTKKGQPHQKTTGVTNTSCTQPGTNSKNECQLGIIPPIARMNTGAVNKHAIQNRRLMSTNSGFGPSSSVSITSSKAIPHFGQLPGWS